jgi:hypothetical protein
MERKFKLPFPTLFGYLGFASCSYFVYWSGTDNLFYLFLLILLCCAAYWLIFARQQPLFAFKKSWFMTAYVATLYAISYGHSQHQISFPSDNLLVLLVSIIFVKIFLWGQESREVIASNIEKIKVELSQDS